MELRHDGSCAQRQRDGLKDQKVLTEMGTGWQVLPVCPITISTSRSPSVSFHTHSLARALSDRNRNKRKEGRTEERGATTGLPQELQNLPPTTALPQLPQYLTAEVPARGSLAPAPETASNRRLPLDCVARRDEGEAAAAATTEAAAETAEAEDDADDDDDDDAEDAAGAAAGIVVRIKGEVETRRWTEYTGREEGITDHGGHHRRRRRRSDQRTDDG